MPASMMGWVMPNCSVSGVLICCGELILEVRNVAVGEDEKKRTFPTLCGKFVEVTTAEPRPAF